MAERAGDARSTELPAAVEEALDADDGVRFSRVNVIGRVVEVTLPALIAAADFAGIAVASTLRPRASAVFGLTPGPTPPSFAPWIAWWSPRVAPEGLVAERVEAEDLPAPLEELLVERLGLRE